MGSLKLTKRLLSIGVFAAFAVGTTTLALAKNEYGKKAIARDLKQAVADLDSISREYNAKPAGKSRTQFFVTSFEKFLHRPLSTGERDFMTKEFANMGPLPRFDYRDNSVQIYSLEGK